jgi:protein-disulfide isomerase
MLHLVWIAALIAPASAGAQEAVQADGPWWLRLIVFIVSLPYTLYMVFVDGQRLHLLPAPLLAATLCLWSFREWRRQGFWTPRVIHVLAALGLATIVLINVDWVLAGGEMWTQRYVVIAIFGLFPYVVYLMFLGPKFMGRRRADHARRSPHSSDLTEGSAETTADRFRPVPVATTRRAGSYALIGGLLGIVALGLIVAAGTAGPTSVSRPDLAVLLAPESLVPMARGVVKGDPDAPFTIVEFGDYQCLGCGKFHRRSHPQIDSMLVDTGRARLVFFDLPLVSLHANAFLAARAAHCAEDQERFWEYQDELYREQRDWSSLTDARNAFGAAAGVIGLDPVDFRACLGSELHTDVVDANRELARRLGIRTTPTIVISQRGGETREVTDRTFRSIERAIEEMKDGRRVARHRRSRSYQPSL